MSLADMGITIRPGSILDRGEAAPITVYIVKIRGWANSNLIGAAYRSEKGAQDEVDRIKAANSFADATYVERELGE